MRDSLDHQSLDQISLPVIDWFTFCVQKAPASRKTQVAGQELALRGNETYESPGLWGLRNNLDMVPSWKIRFCEAISW